MSKKNGASLFLPAAGYRYEGSLYEGSLYEGSLYEGSLYEGSLYSAGSGSSGNYWSRSLVTGNSSYAYSLYFPSSGLYWHNANRYVGLSVRPVRVSASE